MSPEEMFSKVNHPKHYTTHPSGIECITITRHMNFNLGNAIKYIWRAGEKEPNTTLLDLEKAIWYIKDEIDRLKKEPKDAYYQSPHETSSSVPTKPYRPENEGPF